MINYNDEKTWELFREGLTKGVFQLESNLGRSWSKKVAPENLEELAALISIIRPGCLKAVDRGKTMSNRFVDRKWLKEEVDYLHESLEEILKPTYGVLVYQEQAMRIAQKLAGFDLQQADDLRKAIGKKKADLMAKIKKDFIAGCENVGMVSASDADEIFSWIEKSARYSFNKSHAVAYGFNAYWSAWYKANHTKEFFLSYLYHAHEKQDPHQEIYELVNEAKLFDIAIKAPKLSQFSLKFSIFGEDIQFGIKDIKGLTGVTGEKTAKVIEDVSELIGKPLKDLNWLEVMLHLASKINSTAFKALASIGFFSTKNTGVTRNQALYEYLIFKRLTKKEQEWCLNNYDESWETLEECFTALGKTKKEGGGCSNINRVQIVQNEIEMLKNPPYDLSDDPAWIVQQETKLMGCPISLSKIDAVDTSIANTTCKEIMQGKTGDNICVVANLSRVATHKIKKGKAKGETMCFLTIEDATGTHDSCVVFPKIREKYKYILFEDNNLMLCGKVEQDNSFIIENIHEI